MLARGKSCSRWPVRLSIAFATGALVAAIIIEFQGHWQTGLSPVANSYGALVYAVIAAEGQLAATAIIMGLYTFARSMAGLITPARRATFDNTMLFWYYTVGQGLASLLIVHGFPRLAG